MKLAFLALICLAVAGLQGFALGLLFPGPLGIMFSMILGWLFGYYVAGPALIREAMK